MNAHNSCGTHIWLAMIACVAFAQATPAQIPVIEPSDFLADVGDADIDDRTIAVTGGYALSSLLVLERSASGDWVEIADVGLEEEFGFFRVALQDGMAISDTANSHPDECFVNVIARRHGTWQRVQKLPYCGRALAVGTRLAAVGNLQGFGNPTLVYVFRRNPDETLELETTLSSVGFGEPQVAIAGDTVLVGDPIANDGRGVVHVFEEVQGTWQKRATLTASDPETTFFGRRLQTFGYTALIEAFDAPVNGRIVSYVFRHAGQGWSEQSKLASTDPSVFLFSVALVDQRRVVVELRREVSTTRYLARIGGTEGWTPIAQLGEVLPWLDLPTITAATRGFVLSRDGLPGISIYDVRGWQ